MNALLNIQIRVMGQQAAAQLKRHEAQLNALQRSAHGGAGALRGFNQQTMGLAGTMERFGKNLQWSGRQLEYNFTLPLVLAGGAATKWALDNEKAMTRVRKVYGDLGADVKDEIDALETSFTLLSNLFGTHLSEVIDIGAAWAQAGAQGVAVAKATRSTLEAMMLGDFGADEAIKNMIAVQSAYRLNTDQLAQALANLNAVENTTSINLQGLVEVVTRAGGASRAAGIELEELAAMASVLVPAAGTASQAGNSLRTVFSRLLAPTGQAAQNLKEIGIEVDSVGWQSMRGTERLEAMSVAFNNLTANQQAVVSATVASRWQVNRFNLLMEDVYLSLDEATRGLSSYGRALDAIGDGSEALGIKARELSEIMSSSPRAFQILTTNIKNTMAQAIMPLLPMMVTLLKGLSDLIRGFTNLSPRIQNFVLSLAVMLAVIGPVARYIGTLGILFGTLGKAFGVAAAAGSFFTRILFGQTVAHTANIIASEAENVSYIRKYGLIGGLARLIAGPFVLAYQALRTAIVLTSGLLASFFGLLGHGAWAALRVFSGAVVSTMGAVTSVLATAMPVAVRAVLAGVGSAITGAWTLIAGSISAAVAMVSRAVATTNAILAASATFTQAVWGIAATGIGTLWAGLARYAFVAGAAVSRAWWASVAAIQTAWYGALGAITAAKWTAVGVWITVTTSIQALWITASRTAVLAWVTGTTLMGRASAVLVGLQRIAAVSFAGAWTVAAALAAQGWAAFLTFMRGVPLVIGALWPIIVGGTAKFAAAMVGIFRNMGTAILAIRQVFALALLNPLLAVIAAVVVAAGVLIYVFRDQIVGAIVAAFNMLPQSIHQSLQTVINMLKSFATAAYNWLSYLNPFARHSPSLVDNVTRGVSTILDQYSRLNGVKAVIGEAVRAHRAFLSATGAASRNLQMEEFRMQRADIVAVAPGAGPAVDSLVSSIFRMRGALEQVNVELTRQRNHVYDIERNLTAAMKPINDAIFNNEMAQKRLRLEMLRMQQDGGMSLDDMQRRYAALNGEIEKMTGRREGLRLSGAGGEILGTFDREISSLVAQRNAMEGMTSPLEDARKAMEDLQLEGEILQLERDIEFDPQLRALNEEREKLAEIESGYRDIESAIRDMESALSDMSGMASAELGRQAQAASRAASSAGAAAGVGAGAGNLSPLDVAGLADFDTPEGTAPPGLGREGDLQDILDFNEQLEQELAETLAGLGGFDLFAPFKQMFSDAWQWIYDNVGPYVIPVWDAITEFFDGLDWGNLFSNPFEGGLLGDIIDTVAGFAGDVWEIFESIGSFLGEMFGPVFEFLAEEFGEFFSKIGDELKNWAPLWDDLVNIVSVTFKGIVETVQLAWPIIKSIIMVALGAIRGAWEFYWPILREIVDAVFDAIGNIIRAALQVIRGIIEFVLGVIQGDWRSAFEGLLTIVDGIWDAIFSVFRFAWDLISGIVKGIVEGIVGFFQWLWDMLVGNSIIPDMVDAIIEVFNFLKDTVTNIWDLLWGAVKAVWDNVIVPVWNAIKAMIDNVLIPAFEVFQSVAKVVWDAIGVIISRAWGIIKGIWETLERFIRGPLNTVFNWIRDRIDNVWNAIGTIIRVAWSGIKVIWETLERFIRGPLNTVFNWIRDRISNVWDAIGIIISAAWNGIKAVWEGIDRFIRGTLYTAFTWLRDRLSDVWSTISTGVSNAWNGILRTMGRAVNFAIDIVNRLIDGINLLNRLPGISVNISRIGHVTWAQLAAGSNRIPEHPFQRGVGGGFKTNNVRAIVGEGNPLYPEYVIPTDPTHRNRAKGLAAALMQDLNLNSWDELHPQYALGGILGGAMDLVGNAWDATGGRVVSGIRKGAAMAIFGPVNALAKTLINQIPVKLPRDTANQVRETMYNWVKGTEDKIPEVPPIPNMGMFTWPLMWNAIRRQFPRARLHSSYRPGSITATGNRSYHGMGRAIDITPSMDMFNWIASNYPNSREIIYSPAGNRQIRNGRPHYYTGVTRSMHWDHVHWAMQQGGIIPSLGNGGIVMPRAGGTLIRAGEQGQAEAVVPLPSDFGTGNSYNFYGDLSFPNITDPADAETFISNLESLV